MASVSPCSILGKSRSVKSGWGKSRKNVFRIPVKTWTSASPIDLERFLCPEKTYGVIRLTPDNTDRTAYANNLTTNMIPKWGANTFLECLLQLVNAADVAIDAIDTLLRHAWGKNSSRAKEMLKPVVETTSTEYRYIQIHTSFLDLSHAQWDEEGNVCVEPFSFRERLETNAEVSFQLGRPDGAVSQTGHREIHHFDWHGKILIDVVLLRKSKRLYLRHRA